MSNLCPRPSCPQPLTSLTTPLALSDAVFGMALSPDMERARVSGGVPRRALRNLRWGNAWMAAPPGHPFFGWLLSQLAPNARHANVMRAARRLALPHDGTRAVDPRARRQRRRRRHHHPPVGHAVQHEGHRGRAAAPVRQRQRARARALRAALQRVARHHLLDGDLDQVRLGGQASTTMKALEIAVGATRDRTAVATRVTVRQVQSWLCLPAPQCLWLPAAVVTTAGLPRSPPRASAPGVSELNNNNKATRT